MKDIQKNLEQKILCSFLSENNTLEAHINNLKYLNIIEPIDFEFEDHQELFKAFKLIDENNKPLESVYIEDRLNPKFESAYICILAQPAISNIDDYVQLLKEKRAKRELKSTALKLLDDQSEIDLNIVTEQIQNIQSLTSKTTTKKFDLSFLKNKSLTAEDIEKADFDYLFDNLIVKAELTMIAAKPGSGKSLTTVAIANHALINKKADTVIYFDLDNSTTTLKQRALNNLLDVHGENFVYLHGSKNTKNEIFRYIKEFQRMDLSDKLFVFDSAKNFMMGGDRDKNKDVSKLTEIFKLLRDKGATVIFLHHTNKPSKDLEELVYSGSSAWEEDTTNAYLLNKNEHKNTFLFTNFKARVGDMHDLAFTYNDNHTLTQVDYDEAVATEEDEEIKDELISYLKENSKEPLRRAYTQTIMSIVKLGYAKNKVAAVMKRNIDKCWTAAKQTENNRTIYTFINNPVSKEPVVTTYKYEYENKSDKSDKSILSHSLDRISDGQVPKSKDNRSFIYINKQNNVDMPEIF